MGAGASREEEGEVVWDDTFGVNITDSANAKSYNTEALVDQQLSTSFIAVKKIALPAGASVILSSTVSPAFVNILELWLKEEVRASNFYRNLVEQIQEKPDIIFSNLSHNIGSTNVMPMVIYGLGSIQCSYAARFQLAYALLLREVAELKIDREITICCDDISSNPVEEKAIKAHGCKVVLMTDGRFRWTADDPTLFFLPFTRTEVLGDLLEVNWCPSRLER
ncbi:hypothetical protein J5N97_009568 [Dioscorea zingiberensis]|uniref:SRR1-like domain-containing protein n=1 Tax=Dioscorea zingiberensis TaxID=325984 RepID=A0A9D5CXT1_9LILI|nr:hypothetical protein J5N97_009568 [Dioscorea zingiberensis]